MSQIWSIGTCSKDIKISTSQEAMEIIKCEHEKKT